jgi:hypothetical protein
MRAGGALFTAVVTTQGARRQRQLCVIREQHQGVIALDVRKARASVRSPRQSGARDGWQVVDPVEVRRRWPVREHPGLVGRP